MFENLDSGVILTILLGLVTTFAGGFWLKAKGKLSKVINLIREILEVADDLEKALEDDKITKLEITKLKKDLNDVKNSWKKLIKKE